MITADCHLHTNFSFDSDTPMESMVKNAIALGLKQICFTDHMDYNYPSQYGKPEFSVEDYFSTIDFLSEKYQGQILIRKGIELGLKPGIEEKINLLTKKYSFDFIIGSSHLVHEIDPFFPDFWKEKSVEQAVCEYFQSILENLELFHDFDAYGHIDYVTRYAPTGPKYTEYTKYQELIDEILLSIIRHQKALEINAAGYKYGCGHPNPHEDIIQRYLQLGGKLITIGSDAHEPQHMAYEYSLLRNKLLALGIKEYAVFIERIPHFFCI
ncbi:MAG: histidinol-phosphatase HisJ family protein [Clostridiales bacterium]|nr:histidinol-phosphatase HisJ family protein [Clostridiales bacterium]